MPLTVIREETRRLVESKWLEVGSDEEIIDFIARVKWDLEQTNPVIAQVLDNFLRNRQGWEFQTEVLIYACSICLMLKLEGALIEVSYEAAAPVQTEFLRDPTTYGQTQIDRLSKENPEIINIARPLISRFQATGDIRSSSMILGCGLLLYKIIEGQKESNELANALESFGSDTQE
jgi:hypothetical protein